jgi:hypothetical protein
MRRRGVWMSEQTARDDTTALDAAVPKLSTSRGEVWWDSNDNRHEDPLIVHVPASFVGPELTPTVREWLEMGTPAPIPAPILKTTHQRA